ncbi:GNAT family N-acetyltransferase [Kytococcus sedentarius]|uniref:GNAT family N-acetyltransferase n=1 Tax=Kytococcus sedentarius TaxID=1276 RepID=UPI0035BBFF63
MSTPRDLTIRPRRDDDLPHLARTLVEQQRTSDYPHRSLDDAAALAFLQRDGEEAAWVAESGNEVVGHVAVRRVPLETGSGDEPFVKAWSGASDRPAEDLRVVGVLFVGTAARGTGAGVALLRHATGFVLDAGCVPCLDVLPTHDRALALYRHLGWREVTRQRPHWVAEGAPDVIGMVFDPPRA